MPATRIKIISRSRGDARDIARQIIEIAKSLGIKYKGPVPFPTRRLKISTRKTPCGDGSHTFEHWEMRIHKWLVEIDGSEQALRQVMRIPVPDTVQIEMVLGG
jgi:small subunit ribosomal protein S10